MEAKGLVHEFKHSESSTEIEIFSNNLSEKLKDQRAYSCLMDGSRSDSKEISSA